MIPYRQAARSLPNSSLLSQPGRMRPCASARSGSANGSTTRLQGKNCGQGRKWMNDASWRCSFLAIAAKSSSSVSIPLTSAAPIPIQRATSSSWWPDAAAAGGARRRPLFRDRSTIQRQFGGRALHALQREGYCGFGDVTVISDGAEILKRLPRAMPKPTVHIIDWSHIAMKIQPMQQIADHLIRSRSGPLEALPSIDRDIRAVKWHLWHGRVDRAIRDLERLLATLKHAQARRRILDRTTS